MSLDDTGANSPFPHAESEPNREVSRVATEGHGEERHE